MMPRSQLDDFYSQFLEALDEGNAALFAGAGLSQPSGFVNWKGLMKDIADELGLNVDKETDLIAVAQYHVNDRMGGRSRLDKLLIEEFTKDAEISENHRLIANLPLHTVWTTNYDILIEQAFREAQKRVDVKISKEDLAITLPGRDAIVYKMHGDISRPSDAVLTKEDYETYNTNRELFSVKLQGDLVGKTFLFLGFSFTDPNIDYILSRIRSLIGPKNQREHFCVIRMPQKPRGRGKKIAEYEYEKRKLLLRIGDLKRYGIRTIQINDYSEVTDILTELNRRSHRKNIFVSGSAHNYEPMGRDRIEELARDLGQEIIKRGYNLVSGFGLNIGSMVILGALETVYRNEKNDLSDRIIPRPFPQQIPNGINKEAFFAKYRKDMLSNSGFVVFICGNKLDPVTKEAAISVGVLEEFEISKSLGKCPIPVGSSGTAARQIWEEVVNSLHLYYPDGGVKKYFNILGNSNKTNNEIIEAIFAIINKVAKN